MKKLISIVLAVMLVVSVAVVSVNAYGSKDDYSKMTSGGQYNPSDSYTVDENTPYAEDAIEACKKGTPTQTIYFQVPLNDGDPKHGGWENKYNTFAGPDSSSDYMHVCIYWWSGVAGEAKAGKCWPSGFGCTWVGYQAHLIDKTNRIYSAEVPNDGGTPVVVWNNGINAGMDETAEIFKFGRQLMDANVEGLGEDEEESMPEGTPDPDSMDGCIQIIDYNQSQDNPLTGFPSYGSTWYVYYSNGCYGKYSTESDHFISQFDNCMNPEHFYEDEDGNLIHMAAKGDANRDGEVDIDDVTWIQKYLCELLTKDDVFDPMAADADSDGYISIIDATRIQRYLAHICDIDGNKYDS